MKKISCALGVVLLIFLLIAGAFFAYKYLSTKEQTPTIKQGFYGKVLFKIGNCMPGAEDSACNSYPLPTEIFIREPIGWASMEGEYLKNKTKLVKHTVSGFNGFYEIELPPGNYAISANEWGKEYVDWRFITLNEELKEVDIIIDHAAY